MTPQPLGRRGTEFISKQRLFKRRELYITYHWHFRDVCYGVVTPRLNHCCGLENDIPTQWVNVIFFFFFSKHWRIQPNHQKKGVNIYVPNIVSSERYGQCRVNEVGKVFTHKSWTSNEPLLSWPQDWKPRSLERPTPINSSDWFWYGDFPGEDISKFLIDNYRLQGPNVMVVQILEN